MDRIAPLDLRIVAERLCGPLGWPGALVTSWTSAGALAGGLTVAGLIATGRLHPEGLRLTTAVFVAIGGVLGCAHGAVLGRLGRPEPPLEGAAASAARNGVRAVLGLLGSLFLALWLSMAVTAGRYGIPVAWIGAAAAGVVAGAVLMWAALLGWCALSAAFARWPEHLLGSALVLGVFGFSSIALYGTRWTAIADHVRLSPVGAVLLAGTATLWIAAPAIVLATLRLGRRRTAGAPDHVPPDAIGPSTGDQP